MADIQGGEMLPVESSPYPERFGEDMGNMFG